MPKVRFSLFVILVSAALFLSACQPEQAAEPAPVLPVVQGVIAQGRLVPAHYIDLSFSLPGQVAEVLVQDGDLVTAGQVLARLGGVELRQAELARSSQELLLARQALRDYQSAADLNAAQAAAAVADAEIAVRDAQEAMDDEQDKFQPDELLVAQLEARLALAQAQLTAADEALAALQDGIDPDTLQALQARLSAAQAAEASAQVALQALELHAPMDGVVVGLDLQVGEFLPAGQPVLAVVDFSIWWVQTDDLTELEVVQIKAGQKVSLVFDALPDLVLEGKVLNIEPRFVEKRGDITYTVTLALENFDPRLRWGMTAQVSFLGDE